MDAILVIKIQGTMPCSRTYVEQEHKMRLDASNAPALRAILEPWIDDGWKSELFRFVESEGYRQEFRQHRHALKAFKIDEITSDDSSFKITTYGKWVR